MVGFSIGSRDKISVRVYTTRDLVAGMSYTHHNCVRLSEVPTLFLSNVYVVPYSVSGATASVHYVALLSYYAELSGDILELSSTIVHVHT